MSNAHLAAVRDLDVKNPSRAVLLVLADRANERGEAWPSWRTLERESGLSRSSVHKALAALRQMGFLTWQQRRDCHGDLTSNLYKLRLPSPPDGRGSPPDGLGVVHETDGGSPPHGRRSNIEASNPSINEASFIQSKKAKVGNRTGEIETFNQKNS